MDNSSIEYVCDVQGMYEILTPPPKKKTSPECQTQNIGLNFPLTNIMTDQHGFLSYEDYYILTFVPCKLIYSDNNLFLGLL